MFILNNKAANAVQESSRRGGKRHVTAKESDYVKAVSTMLDEAMDDKAGYSEQEWNDFYDRVEADIDGYFWKAAETVRGLRDCDMVNHALEDALDELHEPGRIGEFDFEAPSDEVAVREIAKYVKRFVDDYCYRNSENYDEKGNVVDGYRDDED